MPFWFQYTYAVGIAKLNPLLMVAASSGDDHGGGYHLPNLVWILHEVGILPDGAYHWAETWVNIIFAFIVAILFTIIVTRVYAKRKLIPGPFQNAVEMLVEGMYNFLYSILGKEAKKYTPFLGTLFFYILGMNWLGLIPGGHSPTTSLNITASMSIMVFLYVQYTGVRRLSLPGYLHHMAGSPSDVVTWCLVPLMFPLHLIGELAKPFSLALRLFGNITGEDTLVAVFVVLGIACLSFINSPVGLPLHLPFILLGMLLSTIQALVFTLLSTAYILMMLPHEEHAH
ncbi:MAG: F0F1 ATP synthase subunit A [candidate division Zixibacteria bacterium]|nr:F0F1 ATP synthase subunit A [candidate division Zixibacteria bacterium]